MSHISTIYNQILHPEINSGHQFERLEKPFRRPPLSEVLSAVEEITGGPNSQRV